MVDLQTPPRSGSLLEKKLLLIAILVSALQLGLIAYAAWVLGIGVPTCVTDVKPFDQPALIRHPDDRHYEIHFVAQMWSFEPRVIQVPLGSTVDIYITSKDVLHGFHLNGTNVNLMVAPSRVNSARLTFSQAGIYRFVCHEYCGVGHQAMSGSIEVSSTVEDLSAEGLSVLDASTLRRLPRKLSQEKPPEKVSTPVYVQGRHPGQRVMKQKGCVACHSTDGSLSVGPSLKGIWGQKVEFTDGSETRVDEAYIKESILEPAKKIVKGYSNLMPVLPLTEQEIKDVTDYIKTLR